MGNSNTHLSEIEIDPKVIEVFDFWTQHAAFIENTCKVTIFSGDLFINEPLWGPITPLEKLSKNLMRYRHPHLMKYIYSWKKTSKCFLAVEHVTPLSQNLSNTTPIEICLGLYSILKALCFLHKQAAVSHNNVCLSSIFINKDGYWELGGMEYLCNYKELTADYLSKSRNYRCNKSIDTNEGNHIKRVNEKHMDFIDVYAFCVLVNDLLKNKSADGIQNMEEFKELCKSTIQQNDILQRPNLSTFLQHDIFKNKFIEIYCFLNELPLKSETEKTNFFSKLIDELRQLNEEFVASHLGGAILSRMVLMNELAKKCLLPFILVPKMENNNGLFSETIFSQHIVPKLLPIFSVRDIQIRLLLLKYFHNFQRCFTNDELQWYILPQLLLGIKDTNNELVCLTLHTLADLVPVLGADVVIGGQRATLFKDNRPKNCTSSRKLSKINTTSNISDSSPTSPTNNQLEVTVNETNNVSNNLPERPQPDGEENDTSSSEEQTLEEDNNWDDWGNTEDHTQQIEPSTSQIEDNEINLMPVLENKPVIPLKKSFKIMSIDNLDIKTQHQTTNENDIDFFEDMEPVIDTKKNVFIVPTISNNLCAKSNDEEDFDAEGWDDEWQ